MKYKIMTLTILIICSNFIGCVDNEISSDNGITQLKKQLNSVASDDWARVTIVEHKNDTLYIEVSYDYISKESFFAIESDFSSIITSYFKEKQPPKTINYKILFEYEPGDKPGLKFKIFDSTFTWDDIVKMSDKEMSMITWSQKTESYFIRDEIPLSEDSSKENVKSVLMNRFDLISSYDSVILYDNGILEIEVMGIYTDLDKSVYPVEVEYSIEIVDAFKNADKPDKIIFTILCNSFDVNAEYEVRETSLNWTETEKLSNEDMSINSWASNTISYDILKQT